MVNEKEPKEPAMIDIPIGAYIDDIEREKKLYVRSLLAPYLVGAVDKNGVEINSMKEFIEYMQKQNDVVENWVDISPTYRQVLEHRNTCPYWGVVMGRKKQMGCIECFGGGVKNLIQSVLTEILEHMENPKLVDAPAKPAEV